MSHLFISHSSKNDDWAIALKDWLVDEGWSGPDDIFLDLDPERGIAAGQRWAQALEDAATRCEAVLFVVSEEWLASKWCSDEYQLADRLNKKLFALLIDDIALDRLPGGLSAQWQIVRLKGEPAKRFLTVHPLTQRQSPVHIAETGLTSLKRGLEKAGIGAETFELQPDQDGPLGWRAPYRGLEALEPEDAAVFFGRNADIVRGIDMLRGLAGRKPPRLLVILGASGAGKSSFLRAGLWPRLLRDDSQWLALRAIRSGRGGAIEGGEGLLAALEEAHRRFGLPTTRADLRDRLVTQETFIALLQALRMAAAKRALIAEPPYPLPVLCLDQGEEVFAGSAPSESEKLLVLARAAIDADVALLLVSIRSDSYGGMQGAKVLAGIDQAALTLGPVPHGEIARVIREPAEILRRKAGPVAPVFDAAVVERLQQEIEGEEDALPLLAFVLQRLMREHQGVPVIGITELARTGGVAAAIESAAEAALDDAGIGRDRVAQREALRRLFIPQLARIDRDSKTAQRRVARQSELPRDLLPLAHALTQRRLLVVKVAAQFESNVAADTATLEVAHEALLRRWPTLAELLADDRDSLLLLDGLLSAASDWDKAEAERKADFLVHRGSRLSDAQALVARGPDWERQIAPAQAYLAACVGRETADREEKEAALAREQARLAEIAAAQARTTHLQRRARWALAAIAALVFAASGLVFWQYATNLNLRASLQKRQIDLARAQTGILASLAATERLRGNWDTALRFSVHGTRLDQRLDQSVASPARAEAAADLFLTGWYLILSGHQGQVTSATFSPDGLRVVTTSGDDTARVWDGVTGKTIMVLSGHVNTVMAAAFSPDGSRIVTSSLDNTARVWEATSGKMLMILRGHTAGVWPVAFSPDGSRLVTGSFDHTARIWNATTGKEIAVLSGHTGEVRSAAFSHDGTRIITASIDGTARVWDVATDKEILSLNSNSSGMSSANFSLDGTRIVTGGTDKMVRIWDAKTGKQLIELQGHDAAVMSASFSPDGTQVVSASFDRTARLWEATTGKEIAVLRGHEGRLMTAAFNSDGKRIVTSSLDDRTARLWHVDSIDKVVGVLRGHDGTVRSVAFRADEKQIVTGSADKTARVWDAATGKQLVVLRGHTGEVWSAAFSHDGTRVVTGSEDKTARVWDVTTGNEIMVLRGHEDTVYSVAFSPDDSKIVTGSADNTARIWNVATGKQIAVIGHTWDGSPHKVEAGVHSVGFSPNGKRIVTGSADDTALIWDAATGQQLAVLKGHADAVWSAAFSPDGSQVVTGSRDKTARIWDATTGREIEVLLGHDDQVLSVAFNFNGRLLVTGSADRTARIWDVPTAREIAVLRGHTGVVWSSAFSPKADRIITGSQDDLVGIWDSKLLTLSTDALVAEICHRRLAGMTKLDRGEMRLAGYSDTTPEIDVCAGVE